MKVHYSEIMMRKPHSIAHHLSFADGTTKWWMLPPVYLKVG